MPASPSPATFPDLLEAQLRADGSRPLVTFYDDATGERVELSVVTYANWVAKTAGLLQDELGLEHGDLVRVDLPSHWLTPVWLGAAWSVGLAVTTDPADAPDLVVCGPDGLARYAARARPEPPVVALSLRPMGARFDQPLPEGVVDYGAVVWGQPDAFLPDEPPQPDDVAWRGTEGNLTQGDVAVGGGGEPQTIGARLLTDLSPATEEGVRCFLGPLVATGGTVWVAHPDPDGWQRRGEAEQATAVLRSSPA